MTRDILLFLGGIGVLYFGAEWLVRGSARLAALLGISPIIVGLTVVFMGTSAPELMISLSSTRPRDFWDTARLLGPHT